MLSKSLNPEYNFLIHNNFLQQKGLGILKPEPEDNIHELPHLYPDSAIYNAGVVSQSAHKSSNYIENVIVYRFLYDSYQWLINVSSEKEAMFITELFINKMKIEYFAKLNGFTPSYLDEKSVDELVNWDAEKYRQDLLK